MTLTTIAFAMMLTAVSFGVVILPFLFGATRAAAMEPPGGALLDLRRKRDRIYESLRDLEFDQATGKISAEDYAELSAGYKRQAIALLKQLDDEQRDALLALDREIENAIAARRTAHGPAATARPAKPATRRRCVACGAATEPDDRFCRQCGVPIATPCAQCGTPPNPGDRFCPKCGTTL